MVQEIVLGILVGHLVICGACFSRPHNIFGGEASYS